MVNHTTLRYILKQMSYREPILYHIFTFRHVPEGYFVAGRNPCQRTYPYTIDVEAATCLDIVYRYGDIVCRIYLYEFSHNYPITVLTAARIPSF